tara:strand:+ start:5 stop:151 length:147 start_codon:yes stop_codon:yes gene_type:complete
VKKLESLTKAEQSNGFLHIKIENFKLWQNRFAYGIFIIHNNNRELSHV